MRRIVLTFGLLGGAVLAVTMIATMPFEDKLAFGISLVLGYTTMVLSALFIYFGVRSYRENVSGGRLTFARGFAVGILIALVTACCYVATWEVIYFKFMPDFADKYAAKMVQKAQASGATPEKIQKAKQDAEHFRQSYNNLFVNVGMTFLEILPVSLLATLLSAAVLRRKSAPQTA